MKLTSAFIVVFLLSLSACSAPKVISERQAGDTALSCSQLTEEIKIAEDFKDDARDEKGMTGTNVAAGLFFWPALLVTYNNVGEAIDAAEDRIDNLLDIGRKKGCRGF
jgi:hypothetical protein